jgi:hypothetical protein
VGVREGAELLRGVGDPDGLRSIAEENRGVVRAGGEIAKRPGVPVGEKAVGNLPGDVVILRDGRVEGWVTVVVGVVVVVVVGYVDTVVVWIGSGLRGCLRNRVRVGGESARGNLKAGELGVLGGSDVFGGKRKRSGGSVVDVSHPVKAGRGEKEEKVG